MVVDGVVSKHKCANACLEFHFFQSFIEANHSILCNTCFQSKIYVSPNGYSSPSNGHIHYNKWCANNGQTIDWFVEHTLSLWWNESMCLSNRSFQDLDKTILNISHANDHIIYISKQNIHVSYATINITTAHMRHFKQ